MCMPGDRIFSEKMILDIDNTRLKILLAYSILGHNLLFNMLSR